VTSTVLLFHQGFWLPTTDGRSGDVPATGDLLWSAGAGLVIAVASIAVGQYVFSRLDGRFAQEL
jgi:ABC-2 type transport system permease protein